MLYKHSGDKIFPKTKYRVCITYGKDDEVYYDIDFDDAMSMVNSQCRFFELQGMYVNLTLARDLVFLTYIWGRKSASETMGWILLDDKLLERILSDSGQMVMLKREMNVPT
jgi:hypothetical protein